MFDAAEPLLSDPDAISSGPRIISDASDLLVRCDDLMQISLLCDNDLFSNLSVIINGIG